MKAFISYSHKDDAALGRLHTHLAVLRREGRIETWFDREILAGGEIDAEVAVARTPMPQPDGRNSRWSLDFMHDQLASGRRFRVLNIIDDVTKECLAAIPDTSLSGKRVVRELAILIERRGRPRASSAMARSSPPRRCWPSPRQ